MKLPPNELDDYQSPNFYPNAHNRNGLARDPNSPTQNNDFSEYMWMEHEEEFDKEIMQQLEEEALMEECIEAMFSDEEEEEEAAANEVRTRIVSNGRNSGRNGVSNGVRSGNAATEAEDLCQRWQSLTVAESEALAMQSTLNPNAAEFVPRQRSENRITVRSS